MDDPLVGWAVRVEKRHIPLACTHWPMCGVVMVTGQMGMMVISSTPIVLVSLIRHESAEHSQDDNVNSTVIAL